MESTGLLLLIFGLWVAVVIPVWWRERQSGSVHQVKIFRSAMQHLREGQVLPQAPAAGSINYKRAPKVGAVSELRERGLRRRRIGFVFVIATLPLSALLQLSAIAPIEIWVLPPLAAATFVAYARYSLSQLRKVQSMVTESASTSPATVFTAAAKPAVGGTLTAGLSALRKIAMRRLVETEPQVKPQEAAAWQPASEFGSPWNAPTPILPSYVTKSAPTFDAEQPTVQPLAGVDGNALVAAAKAQRDAERELAALAEQVAAQSKAVPVAADDDTSEIIRIIGA